MSTNWLSVHVRCPFYRDNGTTQVSCEGIWPGTTVNVTRFRSSKQTLEHMRQLCMSRYTRCRLYGCIEEKYEERLESPYALVPVCAPEDEATGDSPETTHEKEK